MPTGFDASRFLDQYRSEIRERLDRSSDLLMSAEATTDPDCVAELVREFHTVKGVASMMGFQRMSQLAHKLEDVVSTAKSQGSFLTAAEISSMLHGVDELRNILDGGETGIPAADQESQRKPDLRSIRVSTTRLHEVADRASQIISLRAIMDEVSQGLRECCELVSEQSGRWRDIQEQVEFIERLNPGTLGGAVDHLLSVGGRLAHLRRVLDRILDRHVDLTDRVMGAASNIYSETVAIEMVNVSAMGNYLRRAVRDIAERQGKKIDFRFDGSDTRINRMVLDAVTESLLHLVRNAADHGVEDPKQRSALGKPELATIALTAINEGEYVRFVLEDDGRGLDFEAIERRARTLGMVDEGSAVTVKGAMEALVFADGLSTKEATDEVSGRGVGLGIVKRRIESVGGTVHLESVSGEGTRFTILIPSAAFLVRSLVCEAGEYAICVPVACVKSVARGDQAEWLTLEGRRLVRLDGASYPLLTVCEMTGTETGSMLGTYDQCDLITVRVLDRTLVLAVDRVIDEAEVLVKPLGKLFRKVTAFSGATLLSGGRIGLVVSMPALAGSRHGHARDSRGAAHPDGILGAEGYASQRENKRRVLVVDDSLTSRELLRSVLESEGLETIGAADGVDALEKLRSIPVDLVVTDIEMPGIDGFALCRRIREGDSRYSDIPVVVVTTRDRSEDRRQGLEAGANAYVVKKAFDQEGLLETIDRLISKRAGAR